jgi:hypothetical protein
MILIILRGLLSKPSLLKRKGPPMLTNEQRVSGDGEDQSGLVGGLFYLL